MKSLKFTLFIGVQCSTLIIICFTQGDLHEFLMSHSPRSETHTNEHSGQYVLEQNEMLFVATQIAAGNV